MSRLQEAKDLLAATEGRTWASYSSASGDRRGWEVYPLRDLLAAMVAEMEHMKLVCGDYEKDIEALMFQRNLLMDIAADTICLAECSSGPGCVKDCEGEYYEASLTCCELRDLAKRGKKAIRAAGGIDGT